MRQTISPPHILIFSLVDFQGYVLILSQPGNRKTILQLSQYTCRNISVKHRAEVRTECEDKEGRKARSSQPLQVIGSETPRQAPAGNSFSRPSTSQDTPSATDWTSKGCLAKHQHQPQPHWIYYNLAKKVDSKSISTSRLRPNIFKL